MRIKPPSANENARSNFSLSPWDFSCSPKRAGKLPSITHIPTWYKLKIRKGMLIKEVVACRWISHGYEDFVRSGMARSLLIFGLRASSPLSNSLFSSSPFFNNYWLRIIFPAYVLVYYIVAPKRETWTREREAVRRGSLSIFCALS
jgi:hypothetical protein